MPIDSIALLAAILSWSGVAAHLWCFRSLSALHLRCLRSLARQTCNNCARLLYCSYTSSIL